MPVGGLLFEVVYLCHLAMVYLREGDNSILVVNLLSMPWMDTSVIRLYTVSNGLHFDCTQTSTFRVRMREYGKKYM